MRKTNRGNSTWSRQWLPYVGLLAIPVLVYFGWVEWQTWRGEQALAATQLEFRPFDQALLQAQASGKPVLADFSAIWCPSCLRLHADVFTDEAVKTAIVEGYVLSRIDYESAEAPAFMAKYGVQGFPTLLVIAADGTLLRRLPVSFDPAVVAAQLKG